MLNTLFLRHFPSITPSTHLVYETHELPGGLGFQCKLTLPLLYSRDENIVFLSGICRKKREAEESCAALVLRRNDLEERLNACNGEIRNRQVKLDGRKANARGSGESGMSWELSMMDVAFGDCSDDGVDECDYNDDDMNRKISTSNCDLQYYLSVYLVRKGIAIDHIPEDIRCNVEKTQDGLFIATMHLPRIYPDNFFIGKAFETIRAAKDSAASLVMYRPDLDEKINAVIAAATQEAIPTLDASISSTACSEPAMNLTTNDKNQILCCANNHPLCGTDSTFFNCTSSSHPDQFALSLKPEVRSSILGHQCYIKQSQSASTSADTVETRGGLDSTTSHSSSKYDVTDLTVFCSACSTKVGKDVNRGNIDLIEFDLDGVTINGRTCAEFVVWGTTVKSWTTLSKFSPFFKGIQNS